MKISRKILLLVVLVVAFSILGYRQNYVQKKKIDSQNDNKVTETIQPTPTKCPDVALPLIWMNGKLYRVETTSKSYAGFREEDYIGSVEKEVAYNKAPTQEMASNCMPIGTKIYKSFHSDDIYYGVGVIKNNICYYRLYVDK